MQNEQELQSTPNSGGQKSVADPSMTTGCQEVWITGGNSRESLRIPRSPFSTQRSKKL